MMNTGLSLTITLQTRNRAEFLQTALESLLAQDCGINSFNVLVIDNASTDKTQAVIAKYAQKFPHFHSCVESTVGLSHARNKALALTETPWIGFLDDDGKARTNWVSEAIRIIEMHRFECFGGVFYKWLKYGPLPDWLEESFVSNASTSDTLRELDCSSYPSGGNCFYDVKCLREAGCFPINLGMSGKKIAYAEENVAIQRMRDNGCRIGFAPSVVIDHCVQKYKYSMLWQIKSRYARGRDLMAMDKLRSRRRSVYSVFRGVAGYIVKQGWYVVTHPSKKAVVQYILGLAWGYGELVGRCRMLHRC